MCRLFDHGAALLMGVVLWSCTASELGLWGGVAQPAKLLINLWSVYSDWLPHTTNIFKISILTTTTTKVAAGPLHVLCGSSYP